MIIFNGSEAAFEMSPFSSGFYISVYPTFTKLHFQYFYKCSILSSTYIYIVPMIIWSTRNFVYA